MLEWNGVKIYPNGYMPYGQDVLIPHAKDWFQGEPGLIITLIDAWVLPAEAMKGHPCACWTPVDGYPAAPRVVKALKDSGARPIAMSRFGEKAMTEAGLDPLYVPHAIDMELFKPAENRDEIRKGFGWQDNFVVGMVAANIGNALPRKGWSAAFQAFAAFAEKHDDAILMCHTEPFGAANGVNLANLAKACGIDGNRVTFAEPYLYRNGYPIEYMPHLYNAFDVLLNPSLGEGFGIPLIEAQGCGCPVIATDWSAMSELATEGWLIQGEKVWTDQEAFWKLPHVSEIVDALEDSYTRAFQMREEAREFALQYDANAVFSKYWEPALAELEKSLPELIDPADVIDAHSHTWAETGLQNADGSISAPCTKPSCPAELTVKDGERTLRERGFGTCINGIDLDLEDDPKGAVAKIVCREVERDYDLTFELAPGDTVVDVGAHIGIVSIYLAKRFPGIKVLALEPVPENYARLCRNIEANGVSDSVTTIPMAVTGDGRGLNIAGDLSLNSGGVSAYGAGDNSYSVASITLARLLEAQGIDRVALLKIDCEGSEYEILTPDVLAKVDRIRGEFHRIPDHVPEDLLESVRGTVPDTVVAVCG